MTHRLNRTTLWLQEDGGKGGGERQGVRDGHVHTAISKMENQQGPAGRTLLNVMWSLG